MKTLFILLSVCVMGFAHAQKDVKKQVTQLVKSYSKAGDTNDGATLKKILHDNYRVVLNDGISDPFFIDKSSYIAKIESKEWGGDKRKVTVYDVIHVDAANAIVKAILDGEKASMESFFSLIKKNGEWLIVQELVKATFK